MTPAPTDDPTSRACIACRRPAVARLADFGPQPVGHHFLDRPDEEAGSHPIVLGVCDACGLAQLIDPIPPKKLTPHVDWIRYNEPESHLDRMVETLARFPGLSSKSRIAGISYKEDSSLRRFNDRGFTRTFRLEPSDDLGIDNPCAGVECLQQSLNPSIVPLLRQRHGTPDLILVRHVLEHTHDTSAFLETFRQWVAPGGHVVFEIPDCARGFDLLDYTTLWEDHSLYFVEHTFQSTLRLLGFPVVEFHRYPARYEHCLVAVTKPGDTDRDADTDTDADAGPSPAPEETARVRRFANSFPERRQAVCDQLKTWKAQGPVALFGAGHQASTYLNLLGLDDLVDFVIDDHPKKTGRFMPGCRLPIIASDEALTRGAKVWLSSVGVESERRILDRNRAFLDQGGTFVSIYPTEPGELFTPIS
ncbi:MAG: methyltransferase domain-containing protein [Limisphaerales bacterium]